jgi:hypothetical protein
MKHGFVTWLGASAVLIAALVGCATSTVVPVGKDSYALSVTRCGVCESPRIAAYSLANDFCAKQSKVVSIRNVDGSGIVGGPSTANLVFACIDPDDPDNQRANLRPDRGVTTIERR